MSAIQKYQAAKSELSYAQAWANLIGSPYKGGGGGVGKLVRLPLIRGESAPTVYHQYSDGAKNYHVCPDSLLPHLEAAIKEQFGTILARALDLHSAKLKELAKEALAEHKSILADAGLDATEAT